MVEAAPLPVAPLAFPIAPLPLPAAPLPYRPALGEWQHRLPLGALLHRFALEFALALLLPLEAAPRRSFGRQPST